MIRGKVMAGIGMVTILSIIFKVYLVLTGEYYFFPAWIENIVIIVGCAILFGGLLFATTSKKAFKELSELILFVGSCLIGTVTYYTSKGWLYMVNIKWVDEKELEYFIDSLNASEIPWLNAIVAVLVLLTTYFVLKKTVYVSFLTGNTVQIGKNIDENQVSYRKVDVTSTFFQKMIKLRDYEYNKNSQDLSFISDNTNDTLCDGTVYIVEYLNKPVGYFVIKDDESICTISEFYAGTNIKFSIQVLNAALKKYLSAIENTKVVIKNIDDVCTEHRISIELIAKDISDDDYELEETVDRDREKINHDICFET